MNRKPWQIRTQQWMDDTWGFWIVAPNSAVVAKSCCKYTTEAGAVRAAVKMLDAWRTSGIEVEERWRSAMPDRDIAEEPMGEVPEIDTLAAIRRGGVLGLLSAADQAAATRQLAERKAQALNEIRDYVVSSSDKWVAQQPSPPLWEIFNDLYAILERHGV